MNQLIHFAFFHSTMSANYASGLSPCDSKGVCGLPELFDSPEEVNDKIATLAKWIKESTHTVLVVGAGLSTSAGIPDFRGPKGIWTLEKLEEKAAKKVKRLKKSHDQVDEVKEEETKINDEAKDKPKVSLETAKPTLSHLVIKSLVDGNFVKYIISQNIDGLFLKTGIKRKNLAEVHGNFYLDECNLCFSRFIRNSPSPTMALKVSSIPCPRAERPCRGYLRDTVLDWEHELPAFELEPSEKHVRKSQLVICLGTTLQINPIGSLPFVGKKGPGFGRKVVIINLQKTRFDKKADLVIHEYLDKVSKKLCELLELQPALPEDLTDHSGETFVPWK